MKRSFGRQRFHLSLARFLVGAAIFLLDSLLSGRSTTFSCLALSGGVSSNNNGDASEKLSLKSTVVTFSIHRSGEPTPCGVTTSSAAASIFFSSSSPIEKNGAYEDSFSTTTIRDDMNKYQTESFLTDLFAEHFVVQSDDSATACGSTDNATAAPSGLYGFCDMGPKRTVIQNDHDQLVPTQKAGTLPCRYFTREGVRVDSLERLSQLLNDAIDAGPICSQVDQTCDTGPSLHLYAVPAGRMFMFAPSYVGEQFVLHHVSNDLLDGTIVVETISLQPRVFELYNFFTPHEADHLIARAQNESSEIAFALQRSRTGANNAQLYDKRTSENAWDTTGAVSMSIKRRCLEVLGFDEYQKSHTDGLQIIRYKNGQAYIPHADYQQNPPTDPYDYDTSGIGGNRFATILLYMTELGEQDGGETMFENAYPPGMTQHDVKPFKTVISELRATGAIDLLTPGSWEEQMTAMCRTRLALRPKKGRAVLFYSQKPNGEHDTPHDRHGGCPVLNNTKWAANLWVWSAPRNAFPLAPQKVVITKSAPTAPKQNSMRVTFQNSNTDKATKDAKLYYGTNFWADLGWGSEAKVVNTFKSHVWNVIVGDTVVKSFTITGEEEANKVYTI